MDFYKHGALARGSRHISFVFVYFLAIVFSYHTLLIAYNTSSFAGLYTSPTLAGLLHGLAAVAAVGTFLLFPRLVHQFGNVAVGLTMMTLTTGLLLILAFSGTPATLLIALFLLLALNPLGYLVIDVFSETLIGEQEGTTGEKRGLTLALMSGAAVLAPLTMGYLMGEGSDYTRLFIAAAGVGLLFMAVIIGSFRQFYDPPYAILKAKDVLLCWKRPELHTVMFCHFLLQLFFAWFIVYVPLYMFTVMNFHWNEIGVIISAGLLAYVLFEYPIGIIADRYIGEQEMMALGFVILAITTATLGLLGPSVTAFMALMFINRVGASFVEVTTESYFFKHVTPSDAGAMAMFRLLRPGALVVGALLGSLMLLVMPFSAFFLIGGFVMVAGVYATRSLIDTK